MSRLKKVLSSSSSSVSLFIGEYWLSEINSFSLSLMPRENESDVGDEILVLLCDLKEYLPDSAKL